MDKTKAWYKGQTSPPEDITKELYNIANGIEKADFVVRIKIKIYETELLLHQSFIIE